MKLNLIERALIHDALRYFVGGSGIFDWDKFRNFKQREFFQNLCTDLADHILNHEEENDRTNSL